MIDGADDPIDTGVLSQMIGMIYDCALDPQRWAGTLQAVRAELALANAMLTVWKAPEGTVLLNVTSGIEPRYLEALPRYGREIVAQWGGPRRIDSYPLGEPVVLSRQCPENLGTDTPYQRDWIAPQGLCDFMAVAIMRDAEAYCSIGMARHESAGRVGEREVAVVRLLAPHIQRTVAISRLLDIRTMAADTFAATLDGLSCGVVLVDADLRVLGANRAAATLIGQRNRMRVERGAILLAEAGAQAALRGAVVRAAMGDAAMEGRGIAVPVGHAAGDPHLLTVMPLGHGGFRAALAPAATAAVFISRASGRAPAPAEALAALFDLTPAEARVFSSIASGRTVAETARSLGVNVSTARTHLLRLFEKTNTRRQAELVRLALSFDMPVS